MRHRLFALLFGSTLLVACGGDKPGTGSGAQGEDALPKPGEVSGSVTGMPNPGSARAAPASGEVPVAVPVLPAPVDSAVAEAPIADTAAIDGGAEAAVAVLRQYYSAINAGDYGTAHALWSDGGRSSGQTPQQFAEGFAGTTGVSVAFGSPGPIEGAAGSRYVDIPATLEARHADGSVQSLAGTYTLRMSVVDGATPEQRSWRIASAELRESSQ